MSRADRTATAQRPIAPDPGSKEEGLDPELLALPAPPRAQRTITLTVMAAAVVAAMGLVVSLRTDMGYSLADPQPTNIGDVGALDPSTLATNQYVRVQGTAMASQAIRFSRALVGDFRIFPLAGQRTVYVQVPEGGHAAMARSEFAGRLVTFGQLGGRYSNLVRYMDRELGLPATNESFLILADETPASYRWTWVLGALCVLFVLLDAFLIVRWFKPVPWSEAALDAAQDAEP